MPAEMIAALRAGACALACALAAPALAAPTVRFETGNGPVTVPVELARDAATRTRGLMHRTDLPAQAGMLFVFADSGERTFWMKDTPLSLDLVFIAADGRVLGVVARAEPFSLRGRSIRGPTRYVLEVHGGSAAACGIAAGVRATLQEVPAATE